MKWMAITASLLLISGCSLFGGDNHAPEFTTTPDTLTTTGAEYVYVAHATDADGDDITIELVDAPIWLSAEEGHGNELIIRGTPTRRHAGAPRIELQARDGEETTMQAYRLHVGYDFAGTYVAEEFTFYQDECGDTYDALEIGGFFTLDVDPFGRFEAGWDPGLLATPVPSTTFEGTYSVSADVLTIDDIDDDYASSVWSGTQFRIESPRLRQTSTLACGARVSFERGPLTAVD